MSKSSWKSLLVLLVVMAAVPSRAAQFIPLPFDRVAREATYIVRGTVVDTHSAWDGVGDVIYTYATIRVSRYFGETTGADTLIVRELGGRVGDITQIAPGLPEIRAGEEVVLLLSQWPGGADYRIHAYNQGKYLVRNRGGVEVLVADPVQQGDVRDGERELHPGAHAAAVEEGLTIEEFATMVESSRAGYETRIENRQ